MCFTVEIRLTRDAIENRFQSDSSVLEGFDFRYYYNAFDNPLLPVITQGEPSRVQLFRWGLIPHWVKDRSQAQQVRKGTYNAREESIARKPSFRDPFKRSRCLVLGHGFFEWQHRTGGKFPWYIKLLNDRPFAFAGICENWKDPETGDALPTFSIVTTRANPLLSEIHNSKKRMPVILPETSEKSWITNDTPTEKLHDLLTPLPQELLTAHPVSKRLNNRQADPHDPSLIEPSYHSDNGLLF